MLGCAQYTLPAPQVNDVGVCPAIISVHYIGASIAQAGIFDVVISCPHDSKDAANVTRHSTRRVLLKCQHAGKHGMVEVLLHLGARVDAVTEEEGDTALHFAVFANDHEIAGLLVASGADPAQVNSDGLSPSDLSKSSQMHACLQNRGGRRKRGSKGRAGRGGRGRGRGVGARGISRFVLFKGALQFTAGSCTHSAKLARLHWG